MKTKILSILAIALLVLCSCNKSEYANVVPANASMVASVNVKDLSEKGDLAHSKSIDKLKQYLGIMVSGKAMNEANEYIDNPANMGIDFISPVYAFKTEGECYGITMKVHSEGDLDDFVSFLASQSICSKPSEKDGCKSGSMLDDVVYTYNGKTLLLMTCLGEGGRAMCKQLSSQLMNQDEDNSFTSTEAFAKLEAQKGDVKLYCNLGAMPATIAQQAMTFMPKGTKKSDFEAIGSVSFEDGRAVLSSSIWSENPKAQAAIDETNSNLRKINGKFIQAPNDFFLYACAGVKGEWLLSQIKESKEIKQMLFMIERGIDIEQMIRSVDGDCAVVFPNSIVSNGEHDFLFLAELKDSKFLSDVDYWKRSMKEYGMTMRDTGKNAYQLKLDDQVINWGVEEDGKQLYLWPSNYAKHLNRPASDLLSRYESDIKESQIFVCLNPVQVPIPLLAMPWAIKFESVIFKSASADKWELIVEMKSKNDNFLKLLL